MLACVDTGKACARVSFARIFKLLARATLLSSHWSLRII